MKTHEKNTFSRDMIKKKEMIFSVILFILPRKLDSNEVTDIFKSLNNKNFFLNP